MTRFNAGDRVRVRADYPPGHVRTPIYLRGREGMIKRYFGTFGNPEVLAYNLKGPRKELYKVSFRSIDLWSDYQGSPRDVVEADIYEHWLEKV
jgi:nitrile hydratase